MATTSILGKYSPYNTILHRIDPRLKLFSLILLMVVVFLPFGNYTNRFMVLGVLALFIFILMLVGRVSFASFFKSLKAMWLMFIFLLIFMFFIPSEGKYPIHSFSNGYTLYYDGLLQVAHIMLRLILMIALTIVLTSTTTPMEITYSLEWFLAPLKLVRFPTQIVSLTISLALRFIPTLLNDIVFKSQDPKIPILNRAFELHYDLIALQPFDDFNKRTSRLVMNWFLIQNGYRPIVFNKPADKNKYIQSIIARASGDIKTYNNYMYSCMLRTQNEIIKLLKKSKVL